MGNTNCLCKSISDFLSLVFQGRPFHKIFSETFAKFRMFLQLPPTGKWNFVFSKSFLVRYKINVSFGTWLIHLSVYISFLDSIFSTHYIGLKFELQVLYYARNENKKKDSYTPDIWNFLGLVQRILAQRFARKVWAISLHESSLSKAQDAKAVVWKAGRYPSLRSGVIIPISGGSIS